MFSVLIPLYNKEKYIHATIMSVLCQTFIDYEIIVVNDSSTDRSLEIVSQIKDERLKIYTKPNGGVSAARNFGIEKASHEYVAFLDADDMWNPTYLENVAKAINCFPSCGMILSGYKMFEGEINNVVGIRNAKKVCPSDMFAIQDYFEACFKVRTILGLTSAVCIKKVLLDSFETPFKIGINCGEDADLWLRIACKTNVAYINRPLMLYRFATENSLYFTNFQKSTDIDYSLWYALPSESKYKYLFLNLFICRYAFGLLKKGEKNKARRVIKSIHGSMDMKTLIKYIITKIGCSI